MLAVLYLNNSWEWSGGYGQYLQWAGYGKAPAPAVDGYAAYMDFASQFVHSDSARTLYARYVKDVITRTNRYTQKRYVDDPTIMSWQIGNEPRAFSQEAKPDFADWMSEAAALIKSLDPNHLVSTGSEGMWGCEMDMDLFEKIHADIHVDYMNIHIWPYNWGWAPQDSLQENLGKAVQNSKAYIEAHLKIAKSIRNRWCSKSLDTPETDSVSTSLLQLQHVMLIMSMFSSKWWIMRLPALCFPVVISGDGEAWQLLLTHMNTGSREMIIRVTRLRSNRG